MATIKERRNADGSRVWRARVRLGVGGRTVDRSSQFRRKSDAVRWAAKTETELREQRVFGSNKRTVADAIDRWGFDFRHGVCFPSYEVCTDEIVSNVVAIAVITVSVWVLERPRQKFSIH